MQDIGIYISELYSVLQVYKFILNPYCLNYCSFITNLDISVSPPTLFFLIILGLLYLPYTF